MDSYTKTGQVYLQPHKTGKKWKPVWLSLIPPSSSRVGRLEIQDMGGVGAGGDHGTGVRRHHQPLADRKLKVVLQSELISVLRLPPNAEACPMENMSAFCVETHDRTMVFAALKGDCMDWVEKVCQSMFQRGGSGSNQLHMEENQIYASAEKASEFLVVVQRTDAATRCGLQGSYWLQVGQEALLLRETQKKNIVREWPYKMLRRYGNDKLALTIEAGRRCDSGPGTFTFETQQAVEIFTLIQSSIKQKTSTVTSGNQNQEGEKVIVTNIRTHPSLPKIPDMSIAAILENNLRTEERGCTALEDSAHIQEDLVGQSECVPAQPAPITLMPLPLVPIHDTPSGSHHRGQSDDIYANPADCIQYVPKLQTSRALYVDPASVLPLKPPNSREPFIHLPNSSTTHHSFDNDHPDTIYSEVYDKVSPVQSEQAVIRNKGRTNCLADYEPIYTEPMNEKEEMSHKNESATDPFAHLYAQICKTASSSPSTSSSCSAPSFSVTADNTTSKGTDESLDDVIYENLGII